MKTLRADDFAAYFKAVHGSEPFPWQERLLRQVIERGWPQTLDLPTGTGKTAVLDVALFHLALEATSRERTAPLRIVLIVDRRTVVDQAHERAIKMADALEESSVPVVRAMKENLRALAGKEPPLKVAVLRGGIARDETWARSPAQPLVVLSTVDQVGSRLLFRGYGVSPGMRPIHAGLFANDALFLLDEVHLSEPFRQTLVAIERRYRGWAERRLPDRWQVVSMSATISQKDSSAFGLGSTDRSHPVLRKRLEASKPVRVVEVKVTGDDEARIYKFASQVAAEAAPPLEWPGVAVAVVVNRVRTARLVFEHLTRDYGETAAVYLLTGRMRPFDREKIESEVKARVNADRTPRAPADGRPTIVVATQCIEAGADFDFDVLITECASLDALRQRFGRLNRLGNAPRCAGVVLMRGDLTDEEDPIYGDALKETWGFLKKQAGGAIEPIDFGVQALDITPDLAKRLNVQPTNAPVLLPAHLDTWVQTSPVPEPDPDVSLWLHGPRSSEPEVQIVWRADLDVELLTDASEGAHERLLARLELCPPLTREAVSVPLSAARRWLSARGPDQTSDVEGRGTELGDTAPHRPALAWRGERSAVVGARVSIEPGDTLVVPSEYGGLLDGSWAPESEQAVSDIGDRVAYEGGRRVLRLHGLVWRWNLSAQAISLLPESLSPPRPHHVLDDDDDDDATIDAWLREVAHLDLPPWLSAVVAASTRRQRRLVRLDGTGASPSYYGIVSASRDETTTDEEVSSFTGVEVALRKHLTGVGECARDFAERCGLPTDLVTALEMSGEWHDIGKADARFQLMLHGGNAFKMKIASEPLAKSALPRTDRKRRVNARERSGYPKGYRHELMSLALMLRNPAAVPCKPDVDLELVLYLVSSHHGHCRPLAPVRHDATPVTVDITVDGTRLSAPSDHGLERLDSGISDRFFTLVERYGWFGLAWLEAILRLADHRRSQWEMEQMEEVSE